MMLGTLLFQKLDQAQGEPSVFASWVFLPIISNSETHAGACVSV